jgi:hypothetical protein
MALEAELTEAVAAYQKLLTLQNPDLIRYWQPPEQLRAEYVRLAETVVYALDKLKAAEVSSLLASAEVESKIAPEILQILRAEIRIKEPALWDALDVLDSENSLLRELMVFQTRPAGRNGRIRNTFDLGIERVEELVDNNRNVDLTWTQTEMAREVLESKLLAFEPDAWLDRVAELPQIRTSAAQGALPGHIRLRIRELYQAYAFGCWFAVLSLARATLEYALLESRRSSQPTGTLSDRTPSLFQLIEQYGNGETSMTQAMHRLRKLGNACLHPAAVAAGPIAASMRASHAAEAVTILVEVLEHIYRPQ